VSFTTLRSVSAKMIFVMPSSDDRVAFLAFGHALDERHVSFGDDSCRA
jgi:hypothetical protein